MISIKKFINSSSEVLASYERMTNLLLQAIGMHAVQGSPTEYEKFRTKIDELQTKLSDASLATPRCGSR